MAARDLDVIVDSCSVRAKHGGELTGPNPTDRGKPGTKYHVVVASDGLPLGAVASAANVTDTRMFPELLRLALLVGVRSARRLADAGYDSADNRWLCLREAIQPLIRKIGSGHGSGRSDPLSRTPTHSGSTTCASTEDRTARPPSFSRCSQPPASLSAQTGLPIYENRLLGQTQE